MTAYSSPILVPAKGDTQVLSRVPLSGSESKAAYDEDWLQDLLYTHPVALPVEDIDTSFTGLVPLCREMPTPAGPVDVVYVTRDGRPVFVEAKLWRNPEARRKVIGQILDYAKELATWDVDDLDAAVRQARAQAGEKPAKGLLEILGLAKDSPEAARFHDSLARNLKRGELVLRAPS
jgi:RecB family endonuclease NucS